jgi:predicted MFS family arabinose efflux permease
VLVNNVGVQPAEITFVYLAGGVATLFSARRIGRWSDQAGPQFVYRAVALFSLLPIMFMTHMPQLPLWGVLLFFPFFMTALSGRNTAAGADDDGAAAGPARRFPQRQFGNSVSG